LTERKRADLNAEVGFIRVPFCCRILRRASRTWVLVPTKPYCSIWVAETSTIGQDATLSYCSVRVWSTRGMQTARVSPAYGCDAISQDTTAGGHDACRRRVRTCQAKDGKSLGWTIDRTPGRVGHARARPRSFSCMQRVLSTVWERGASLGSGPRHGAGHSRRSKDHGWP